MIIQELHSAPPLKLARALDRFEEQFQYPLGSDRSFRIIHGPDYPRFFRSMGDGRCFVAEQEGRVLGVMGAALRNVTTPVGEVHSTVYFGDMKIAPNARGGTTLLRLAQATRKWIGERAQSAYAVVMDGTASVPTRYTGRVEIPLFAELTKIVILRVPTAKTQIPIDPCWLTTVEQGNGCFARLTSTDCVCSGGNSSERSELDPVWLMKPGGTACGRLEDTLRAKRLIADDGTEIRSAHLSCFACDSSSDGLELLQVARDYAARKNFPHLFVALSRPAAEIFCNSLAEIDVITAPATVFGTGLQTGWTWNINTSEI